MAENRHITLKIKLIVDRGVTKPFTLKLDRLSLMEGKLIMPPPSEMRALPGESADYTIEAEAKSCSALGTAGDVIYKSEDSSESPALFNFQWDIPYNIPNSGKITMESKHAYYTLDNGGGIPISGKSITVNVVIRQVGPKS